MPDRRLHRGPHPEDQRLFAPPTWPLLQAAVRDLAWLLTHGYALNSALKLVGDRYQLTDRQRIAVMRASCSDQSLTFRQHRQVPRDQLSGHALYLDGYNVITTLESALAHAVLLLGRDGCLRDMASMHGHYKRVHETAPALELVGQAAADLAIPACHWLLDKPVSNSGRLKTMILQLAAQHAWHHTVDLVPDPDAILCHAPPDQIVATADSIILDGRSDASTGPRWFNLTREIITAQVPDAYIVPLG